jgi:hypothetical protein
MRTMEMPLLRAIRTTFLILAALALPVSLAEAKGGHGGGHAGGHHGGGHKGGGGHHGRGHGGGHQGGGHKGGGHHRVSGGHHGGVHSGRIAHHRGGPHHGALANHRGASRAGAAMTGVLGSTRIRNFGSNYFGTAGYRGSGYGYGNAGYGFGNGGYGYGGGYGYRNSRYVRAYIPGVGWVLVPIRAIRRI